MVMSMLLMLVSTITIFAADDPEQGPFNAKQALLDYQDEITEAKRVMSATMDKATLNAEQLKAILTVGVGLRSLRAHNHTIEDPLIPQCELLQTLDLSHGSLKNFYLNEHLPVLKNLKYLILSYNNIADLTRKEEKDTAFSRYCTCKSTSQWASSSLTVLKVDHNKLTNLDMALLHCLPELEEADFSYNYDLKSIVCVHAPPSLFRKPCDIKLEDSSLKEAEQKKIIEPYTYHNTEAYNLISIRKTCYGILAGEFPGFLLGLSLTVQSGSLIYMWVGVTVPPLIGAALFAMVNRCTTPREEREYQQFRFYFGKAPKSQDDPEDESLLA